MAPYFSDRELGERPRTIDEVGEEAWGGLHALVERKVNAGWFGLDYPLQCPDGEVVCGTDRGSFQAAVAAEIPGLDLTRARTELPDVLKIFDLLEFCHRTIAQPTPLAYHDYHKHHHLRFHRDAGQAAFREEVNRILARQGLAFELQDEGQVVRLGPEPARALIASPIFSSGDPTLNAMLEEARSKYRSPDLHVRKEGLERLWDAFERLKTLEPGRDKKEQTEALLARTSSQAEFIRDLDQESRRLTEIGNQYQIRHFEQGKLPLEASEQVDYLMHRMFAFIWLCLKTTGRLRS